MRVSKINSTNTNIQSFKGTEQETKTTPKEVKDGKKKLTLALTALGIAAAAGAAIYTIRKGQVVKLSDIKFDKGVASLKEDGEKFTGIIKDTLKNGDKVILKYENGIIKNSSRQGSKSLKKIYEYGWLLQDGRFMGKLVNIYENGKIRCENILSKASLGNLVKKSGKPKEEIIKNIHDIVAAYLKQN